MNIWLWLVLGGVGLGWTLRKLLSPVERPYIPPRPSPRQTPPARMRLQAQRTRRQAPPPSPASAGRGDDFVVYFANDPHHRADREYRFQYTESRGTWRAYILRMPSLEGRDPSGTVTHRLFADGRPYVCWDREVRSLGDMQAISKLWADSIQEYIATGKRFG